MTDEKQGQKKESNIRAVIEPNSIAVIGASRNPSKVGYSVFKNLIASGYITSYYAVDVRVIR